MQSEIKYHKIFDHSTEGLIVCNSKGIIELINPSAVKMFRYSTKDQLLGKEIEALIPRKIRKKHKGHMEDFNKSPSNRSMGKNKRLKGLCLDGTELPVEISLSYYKEGEELKAIAFIVDISQRVAVENELTKINLQLEEEVTQRTNQLRDQYKLLKTVSSNFPNGTIYALDASFKILWADGQPIRSSGLNELSLKGHSYTERIPKEIKEDISSKLHQVLQGEMISSEVFIKNTYFSLNIVPLPNEEGEINNLLLVEQDITKNKTLELDLEKSLAKEKSLNELKSRFVSMASHEFRTPLSSILSSTTLIGKYKETEQQFKRDKHISRIKKSVENLIEILNDFLSIDKLESGLIEIKNDTINFIDILKEAIEEVEINAKKGQKFILESDLAELYFESDRQILKSSCENLLSNASKYTAENATINISVSESNYNLLFSVADNGIGVPEEDLDQLFSRFFRAKNVTNIQGTGLGLNIVKKNIELLKGTVTCESQLNVGSTFTIQIPTKVNI